MKFCSQCGEALSPSGRFCPECGASRHSNPRQVVVTEHESRLRAAVEQLARNEAHIALAILEPLSAEDPLQPIVRAYLGVAYLRVARVGDAREQLEEAVRLAPNSFICRSKYAEFLARLGFYDQAVAQLDLALSGAPPDSESRLAAIELRDFSRGKSKGLYYRPLAYPKVSRLIPRGLFGRKALSIPGEN